jgi:2-polyprenyl-3-methyl-5-hydroxy-6-metoxy-1,4-benzoquinol methylase
LNTELKNSQNNLINSCPIESCYICGSAGKILYTNLNDRLFGSKGTWNISKCTNKSCGLLWLNPMPLDADIWKAYSNYYTHSNNQSAILPFLRGLEKGYLNLKYRYYHNSITLFQKLLGASLFFFPTEKVEVDFSVMYLHSNVGGKLLDVGCGNGWFIRKMKELGWDVTGVDFDAKAVDFCKSQGLSVSLGSLETQNYPNNYFDVITINHVIEHLYNPLDVIRECHRILKKGGSLIIETPNSLSWLHMYIYKQNWFSLDPPRHIMIYNPCNLKEMVSMAGFSDISSLSTTRNESWVSIGSRSIKNSGYFSIGTKKQSKVYHLIGRMIQFLSWLVWLFFPNSGGEVTVIAKK